MLTLFDWLIVGPTNNALQRKLAKETELLEVRRRHYLTPAERAAEDAAREAERARQAKWDKILGWTIGTGALVAVLIAVFANTKQPVNALESASTQQSTPVRVSTPVFLYQQPVITSSEPTQAERNANWQRILDMRAASSAPRAELIHRPPATPTPWVVPHHPGAS